MLKLSRLYIRYRLLSKITISRDNHRSMQINNTISLDQSINNTAAGRSMHHNTYPSD